MNCVMDYVSPVRAAMPEAPEQYGRPAGPQPDYSVTGLIYSGPNSWAEPNPAKRPAKFDPEHGEKGPLCVGVAVQRRAKSGISAGRRPNRRKRRAAGRPRLHRRGFGHRVQPSEAGYEANRTLVMNWVNWLVKRKPSSASRRRRRTAAMLTTGPATFKAIFFITVIGMPLAVAFIGGLVWWVRRK